MKDKASSLEVVCLKCRSKFIFLYVIDSNLKSEGEFFQRKGQSF